MKTKEKEILRVNKGIDLNYFKKRSFDKTLELVINKRLISNKECIYVHDIASNSIIHQLGLKKFLGFEKIIDSVNFRYNLIHPDDIEIVNRIEQAALRYCKEDHQNCKGSILYITFRYKKKDDTYIKVLRKSTIYEKDISGFPISILMTFTDISFIDNSKQIKWVFEGKHIDSLGFRNQIYKAYQNFFTQRETDIIKEIDKGNTNRLISENLSISMHTVATHRRSILKKCNCHTSTELILFCKNNGIL